MLSQKRSIPFPVSYIKLYAPFCPDSDDIFNQLYLLYLIQLSLSPVSSSVPVLNSFSLPVVFCLFICFFHSDCRKLFTGEKAKGEDASQWLFKISIFPFIEDLPSSLPTILEMIRWDSYCLISTAQPTVGRRLATGWLCHMPYQLVLDTEELKHFLHPLTIAPSLSNTGTKPT